MRTLGPLPFVFPSAELAGRIVGERGGWLGCERLVRGLLDEARVADPPKIEAVPFALAQLPARNRTDAWTAYRRTNTSRLADAPRPVAFWHLASLDAPTVAVVWSLAFSWTGRVHLTGRVLLVLALTVWCAYVCDRILDARVLDARAGLQFSTGSNRSALRERHFFHWRHRRLLAPLAAAGGCVAGVMAMTFLASFVRERGLVLGAAALVYFSGVHAAPQRWRRRLSLPRPVSKELLVAVLFTAGCIVPAWSRFLAPGAQESSRLWLWTPAIYFAALAWLNCWCIARWESGGEGGHGRFERVGRRHLERMGKGTNLFAALAVAFAGLLLAVIASASHPRSAALLGAGTASALLLGLLDRMRKHLTPLALRAGADLVLLTPVLLFLR